MTEPPESGSPRPTLWRVFPFDAAAAPGEPYSVGSVAPAHRQTGGRFDLGIVSVLYLGETPAHALAEVWRRFTGWDLTPDLLRQHRHPLALVAVSLPDEVEAGLVDLSDPAALLRLDLRPDVLALPASERSRTQAVSRRVYDSGATGFRWWSAIHGGWHTTVLFTDRAPLSSLVFSEPEVLTLSHPAVGEAALHLNLRTSEAR